MRHSMHRFTACDRACTACTGSLHVAQHAAEHAQRAQHAPAAQPHSAPCTRPRRPAAARPCEGWAPAPHAASHRSRWNTRTGCGTGGPPRPPAAPPAIEWARELKLGGVRIGVDAVIHVQAAVQPIGRGRRQPRLRARESVCEAVRRVSEKGQHHPGSQHGPNMLPRSQPPLKAANTALK